MSEQERQVEALTVQAPQTEQVVVVVNAEVLAAVNELGQQAQALATIQNDQQSEAAAALLKMATMLEKQAEEMASTANAPFYKVSKAISDAKQKVVKPLADTKKALKNSIANYIIKVERERLEAERKAAEERAKAEAEAAAKRKAEEAELAELNKSRAEAAAAAGAPAPTPLALPAEAPKPAAYEVLTVKPGQASTSGVKVARKMKVVITDPGNVPRAYCIPSQELVEAAWKRGELVPEFHKFFRVEEELGISAK